MSEPTEHPLTDDSGDEVTIGMPGDVPEVLPPADPDREQLQAELEQKANRIRALEDELSLVHDGYTKANNELAAQSERITSENAQLRSELKRVKFEKDEAVLALVTAEETHEAELQEQDKEIQRLRGRVERIPERIESAFCEGWRNAIGLPEGGEDVSAVLDWNASAAKAELDGETE